MVGGRGLVVRSDVEVETSSLRLRVQGRQG